MAGEHIEKCTVPEEDAKVGSSESQTMRRSRSLNELPGHYRVTILKRQDTERTKARLEAVAAGMEELKQLREQHKLMMEETLCVSSKKLLDQRPETEHWPKYVDKQQDCMSWSHQGRKHRESRHMSSGDSSEKKLEYERKNPRSKPQQTAVKHHENTTQNPVKHHENMPQHSMKHHENMPQHSMKHHDSMSQYQVNSMRQYQIDTQKNTKQYMQSSEMLIPQINRIQDIQSQRASHDRQLRHHQKTTEASLQSYARSPEDPHYLKKQQNDLKRPIVSIQVDPKDSFSAGQGALRIQSVNSQRNSNSQTKTKLQNSTTGMQVCSMQKLSNTPVDSRQQSTSSHQSSRTCDFSKQRYVNVQSDLIHNVTTQKMHDDPRKQCFTPPQNETQSKDRNPSDGGNQTQTNLSAKTPKQENGKGSTSYGRSSNKNISRDLRLQTKYCAYETGEMQSKEAKSVDISFDSGASSTRVGGGLEYSVKHSNHKNHNGSAIMSTMKDVGSPIDYEQRLSVVLTQSNQRFSRGRTQSVHENFYYFPSRNDSRNISTNQKNVSKIVKAQSQTFNADKSNGNVWQNNIAKSGHSLAAVNEKNENPPIIEQCFKATSSSHKSISWDELLVAVGINKKETQNNCENRNNIFKDAVLECGGQFKNIHISENIKTNTEEVKNNYKKHPHLYKSSSSKPYRSQSFSIPEETLRNGSLTHFSDGIHAQSRSIFNLGISRHPSLSTIGTKIVNPLHEVDIRSMNTPGPVHAVTLQYAGLSTRHMSLGNIHIQSVDAELLSAATSAAMTGTSHLIRGSEVFKTSKLQTESSDPHPSHPEDCDRSKPDASSMSRKKPSNINLETQNKDDPEAPSCLMVNKQYNTPPVTKDEKDISKLFANSRSHNSTSAYSPKMSQIKTIDEDGEDVFENCFEPNRPLIKPRSLSDSAGKSKSVQQDTVSNRAYLKSSTYLSNDRSTQDTTDMKNLVETNLSLTSGKGKDNKSSIGTNVESLSPDCHEISSSSSSAHHVSQLLNASVVTVLDEGYVTCDTASHIMTAGAHSMDNSSDSSGNISNVSAHCVSSAQISGLGCMQSNSKVVRTSPTQYLNTCTPCCVEDKQQTLDNHDVLQTPSAVLTPTSRDELVTAHIPQSSRNIVITTDMSASASAADMDIKIFNTIIDKTDTELAPVEQAKQCDITLTSHHKMRQPFKQTDV